MEEIHYLIPGELKIVQDSNYFKFGNDSVFLADFIDVRDGDMIIDFGSGSGVIPLLLAYKQSPARVIGVEIQPGLVEMSRRSVEMNNLNDVIEIREGDLKELSDSVESGSIDQVVSNPPYMPVNAGKITADRRKAIARHEIHVELEDVIETAARVLRFGGIFSMVHRTWRMAEVFSLLNKYRLEPKRLRMIQSRRNRSPDVFLVSARKGGKRGLEVEPVLIVYQGDTPDYTSEVREIYGEGRKRGDYE